MKNLKVNPATLFEFGQLGQYGNADNMFIRQYQFPDIYSEKDTLVSMEVDRGLQSNQKKARRHVKKSTNEFILENWLRKATDGQILMFFVALLKADRKKEWTGYRITATVHRGYGYPIWTFTLFAKHPESDTLVYTGEDAPNVIPRKRKNLKF